METLISNSTDSQATNSIPDGSNSSSSDLSSPDRSNSSRIMPGKRPHEQNAQIQSSSNPLESEPPLISGHEQPTLTVTSQDVEQLVSSIENVAKNNSQTFWAKLKAQLSDIGKTIMASTVAIIVAIVTSLIFNSQTSEKVQSFISEVRQQLPTEADRAIVTQLSNSLGENNSILNQLQIAQNKQVEKTDNISALGDELKQQMKHVDLKFASLNNLYNEQKNSYTQNVNKLENLESKVIEIQSKTLTNKREVNRALLRTLTEFRKQGELLVKKQLSENQLALQESNRWLKSVYYFVNTLPTSEQPEQLSTIQRAMKSILDRKAEYDDINVRLDESLIILSTMESLVESAVLG